MATENSVPAETRTCAGTEPSKVSPTPCRLSYAAPLTKGSSINYVSTFKGGGGIKMLMVADVGEGGVSDLLMSAKIIRI